MALSDITRKTARSDLRSRLGKLTSEEFPDAELNHWLNLGQFDTFLRLTGISDIWYGTTQTISITAAANAITAISLAGNYGADKIAKMIKLVTASDVLIPFVRDTDINAMLTNSNYDSSYGCHWFGEKLYIFVGYSATALSSNSSVLYFIRKPDEMTGDSNVYTLQFTGNSGDGKYFRIWLGDRYVTVYGRTTPPVNAAYDGIVFQCSATAANEGAALRAALGIAFPSGSGVTIGGSTDTCTITGATKVENVDTSNLTFTETTSTCMDVPTEYVDLAIMSAMSKALFKLNMIGEKNQVDSDVASKFNDIRQMYSNEIQLTGMEKAPGQQSPRTR